MDKVDICPFIMAANIIGLGNFSFMKDQVDCIGMVLNELETVARLGLPIIVVVFNDATLSLIAAKQHPVNHGGSLAVDFTRTDFASVARGCGMKAETIDDVPTYDEALRAAFASGQPTLLDVRVDRSVYGSIMDVLRG